MTKPTIKEAIKGLGLTIDDVCDRINVKSRKTVYNRMNLYESPMPFEEKMLDTGTKIAFDKIIEEYCDVVKKRELLSTLKSITAQIREEYDEHWAGVRADPYDCKRDHEANAVDYLCRIQNVTKIDELIEKDPALISKEHPTMHIGEVCSTSIETDSGYRVIVSGYGNKFTYGKFGYKTGGISQNWEFPEIYKARFTVQIYILTDKGLMEMEGVRIRDGTCYADIVMPKTAKFLYRIFVEWVELPYPKKELPEELQTYSKDRREKEHLEPEMEYDLSVDPSHLPDVWDLEPVEEGCTELRLLN